MIEKIDAARAALQALFGFACETGEVAIASHALAAAYELNKGLSKNNLSNFISSSHHLCLKKSSE